MGTKSPGRISDKAEKRAHETESEQEDPGDIPARRAAKRRYFEDVDSVREQARPYRITTARMPIDALTSQWSLGQNRRVDSQHVQKLCDIFANGGLKRQARENFLMVLSSKSEVSNMLRHCQQEGSAEKAEEILDFNDWLSVNGGSLAEVMAGQHRVKALEAYIQQTDAGNDETWWVCEIYDRGKYLIFQRQA